MCGAQTLAGDETFLQNISLLCTAPAKRALKQDLFDFEQNCDFPF
jgi:hypothetical protein